MLRKRELLRIRHFRQGARKNKVNLKNNRPLQVELESRRSDLQNDFKILESMLRGFVAPASNVSVYTNTICVAKYLLGAPKPLNCIVPMQADKGAKQTNIQRMLW